MINADATEDKVTLSDIHDSAILSITAAENTNNVFFSSHIDKYQFVKAFYVAIINFYNSDRYDKEKNEALYLYEVFQTKFGFSMFAYDTIQTWIRFSKEEIELILTAIPTEKIKSYKEINFYDHCINLLKKAHYTLRNNPDAYDIELVKWDYSKNPYSNEEKKEAIHKAGKTNIKENPNVFRWQDFSSDRVEEFILTQKKDGVDTLHIGYRYDFGHHFDVYINGVKFLPDLYLDIGELYRSVKNNGEYELFVCSCSSQGCAGIFDTPEVTSNENTVIWKIFEPKAYIFYFELKDYYDVLSGLKEDLIHIKPVEFWIDEYYMFSRIDIFD